MLLPCTAGSDSKLAAAEAVWSALAELNGHCSEGEEKLKEAKYENRFSQAAGRGKNHESTAGAKELMSKLNT